MGIWPLRMGCINAEHARQTITDPPAGEKRKASGKGFFPDAFLSYEPKLLFCLIFVEYGLLQRVGHYVHIAKRFNKLVNCFLESI